MQDIDSKRKDPKQARAKQTVDTILQATARILVEEGAERLTTNYLARKAGFSIGTIYQYFPNRESIVLALIARQREETDKRIAAAASAVGDGSVEDKIRAIVRALHDAFNVHRKSEQRLTMALLRLAITHGLPTPSDAIVRAIVQVCADAGDGVDAALNEAEVFVLSRALLETLRNALLHGSPLMGTRELEDALVRLVLGFMGGARPASPCGSP